MADNEFFGEQPMDDKEERDREWNALRRKHVKDGYREGSERGHDAQMQTGFDAGFLDGAKATADAGYWLGVSAILDAFYLRHSQDSISADDMAALRQTRKELEKAANEIGTDGDQATLDVTPIKSACDRILKVEKKEAIQPIITTTMTTNKNENEKPSAAN